MENLISDFEEQFLYYRNAAEGQAQMMSELQPVVESSFRNALERKEECFRYVEIGIGGGATFVLIGELAKRLFPRVLGISLEIEAHREAFITDLNPSFGHEIIIGNSAEQETINKVLNILDGEKLDFVHVDGDHSSTGCTNDIKIYRPMVKSGGVLAVHDWWGITGRYPICREMSKEASFRKFKDPEDVLGMGMIVQP